MPDRYQLYLVRYRKRDGEPLSVASRRSKIIPLRGYFRWLTRCGVIAVNPAAELDLPRFNRRLPRTVLSAAETEQVLALPDTNTPRGLRDRAMLELLYATGIRRMELIQLCVQDVDLRQSTVMIRHGKGDKDRLLPMGRRAAEWLSRYLKEGRPHLAPASGMGAMFPGNKGLPINLTWLSTIIGDYVVRSNVGKAGACHLFRHSMATMMLDGGADIRYIQAMLGHASLTTTQIYTHVTIKKLARVHARTHPALKALAKSEQK